MRRLVSIILSVTWAGCNGGDGGDGQNNPPVDAGADAGGESDGAEAGGGAGRCDVSGIWMARMNTQSQALGTPQYANNWYYFELSQAEDGTLEVSDHMDCGIEVRGTVTVSITPDTTNALREHNRQVGRQGTISAAGSGQCELTLEPFWSVRGVEESAYLPDPRTADVSLEQLQEDMPLPPSDRPDLTEDWDGDGEPGVAWYVTGIATGERHTAQRDVTRYFTAPGYMVPASEDFAEDVVIRAEFDGEEVVYEAEPTNLNQISRPDATAEHTLTLRFLGRTGDDPRAAEVVADDPAASCAAIREALPAVRGLR